MFEELGLEFLSPDSWTVFVLMNPELQKFVLSTSALFLDGILPSDLETTGGGG